MSAVVLDQSNPINPPLRILMLEDNPGDAILLRSALQKAFPKQRPQIMHAQTLKSALEILSTQSFDLITVDLHLPDSLDLDSIVATKKACPTTPVLVVSGWSDRAAAREALRLGAQDYIIKGNFDSESLRWNLESAIERQRKFNSTEDSRRREVEKNRTKDEILSMTAHDIRGPLIGVMAYLDSILKGEFLSEITPEQARVFGLMLTNCDQVLALSDEIVQAKKKNLQVFQVHPELVSTRNFFIDLVKELEGRALEKEIRLLLDAKNAPRVFCLDPQLIKRAVANLVHNAILYSPAKTQVEIKIDLEGDKLKIHVQDHGPGIPLEIQKDIFSDHSNQEIADSKRKSKGLGLIIVRRIAECHRGNVELRSKVGHGSRFTLEIRSLDS